MQATVRYLAIVSKEPEPLAEFYTRYMGLRQLARSASGEISLTDDLYKLKERLERYAPDQTLEPEPGGPHYGDYRLRDPNGYPVCVSTTSFGLPPAQPRRPLIRHVALCEPNGDAVAEFYANVLGM